MPRVVATIRSHVRDAKALLADAETALDIGFDGLVLAPPIFARDRESLSGMLPRRSVLAVELLAFAPRGVARAGGDATSLGALDRAERREVIERGARAIEIADSYEARLVLVPTSELDLTLPPRGTSREDQRAWLRRARDARRVEAAARLDGYLSVIDGLLRAADRYKVRLCLQPTTAIRALPAPDETARCLEEFRGAPLGVWPDTAAEFATADLAKTLGLEPGAGVESQCERFRSELAGVTLRELGESGEPRLPGSGRIDRDWLAALPAECVWLVDRRDESADELASAHAFLRGALEGEAPDPFSAKLSPGSDPPS